MKENIDDFLARGGEITHCAPKLAPTNPGYPCFANVAEEPTEELDDIGRMVELAVARHIGPY